MGFFNFSKKTVKNVGLALDLGSRTVGGAVYEKKDDGSVRLLYVARESISFQKNLTGENLLMAMLHSLELVLVHLEKYGIEHMGRDTGQHYHVDTLNAFFSSPWHSSENKILKVDQEKPFVVTDDLISTLLQKEQDDFIGQLSVADNIKLDFSLLERKIIEVRLNGYATANPCGKSAKNLELNIFTTVSSTRLYEKMKAIVSKYFSVEHFFAHSFSLVAFATIRDFFPATEHFLIVQVGGEVTEITVVKKGVIVETVTFPFGHNGLIRTLGTIVGDEHGHTIESLLNTGRDSKISLTERKKIDRAIDSASNSWLGYFNDVMSGFSAETFIPKTIFLFEDSPFAQIFEKSLKTAESSRFTVTAEPFDVKTSRELRLILKDDTQSISTDTVLAMEANFASKTEKGI